MFKDGDENVAQLIDRLKERYLPQGFAHFQELLRNYDTLSLDNCDNVTAYAEKLRRAREQLQECHETAIIGDPIFIIKFLNGLGPGFDNFLSSFYT